MDSDDNVPPPGRATPPAPYEEEIEEAQQRLTGLVYYISIANLMGLLGLVGVWRLFPEQDEVRNIVLTSAMIFAIGLASTFAAYAIFRSSIAISRDADAIAQNAGGDEAGLAIAREQQNEALRRIQSGMRILKMAGICFVASALIGITGLLSV